MDLDQTDFSALLAGEERAWSRFIVNARPVLEAAVHRTFARQGLKPDAGLFQDAISASLERLTADDFALLRRFDPGRGSIRAFLAVVAGSTASNSLRAARRHSGADLSAAETIAAAPATGGQTSGLSENLSLGEISPHQCWHAGMRALHEGKAGAETFLNLRAGPAGAGYRPGAGDFRKHRARAQGAGAEKTTRRRLAA